MQSRSLRMQANKDYDEAHELMRKSAVRCHTFTPSPTHPPAHLCTDTSTRTFSRAQTCAHAHARQRTSHPMPARTHARMRARTHARTHACTHASTHARTHARMQYTKTHMQLSVLRGSKCSILCVCARVED